MLPSILVLLIALLHLYFLVLEMYLWDKPIGLKVFRNTPEKAAITKVLAANQGLYNGFLAAGLIWGLYLDSHSILSFFLICIALAGIFGAMTVSKKIFFIQGLPAIITLLVLEFI